MTQYLPRTDVRTHGFIPQQYFPGKNGQRRWQKVAPYWYNLSTETANASLIVQEPNSYEGGMWTQTPHVPEFCQATAAVESHYNTPGGENAERGAFMGHSTVPSSKTEELLDAFEKLTPQQQEKWTRKWHAGSTLSDVKKSIDFWSLDSVEDMLASVKSQGAGNTSTGSPSYNPAPGLILAAVIIVAFVYYGQSRM